MADNKIDEVSGIETTGHSWDGIEELNNPLPRWWLWTFYLTIIFSVGYMVWYPAIPLISSATPGLSGVTTRGQIEEELAAVAAGRADIEAEIAATDFEDIRKNEELLRFASASGESLYKVYCTQCHGSGASGSPGFPNLNDDDWIWGGDIESIQFTIAHGVRNDESDDARFSDMPAFGRDEILESGDIAAAAEFVLQLSGQEFDAAEAEHGSVVYEENCAVCHGDAGEGLQELGGPRLTDGIWLYGGTREEIVTQIREPKHGVMPAWNERLGEAGTKSLALYIYSLGGGVETASAE